MFAKNHILILYLILPHFALSQNLVPNPSFECGTDICDRDEDSSQFDVYSCQWYSPTRATPDIFSTIISTTCFSGQPNTAGPQLEQPGAIAPHSGKRFAGIFCYGNTTGEPTEYREYILANLTHPLIIGSYYKASMYVACASRMAYASNNLGMYFSVGFTSSVTNEALTSYQPQVISDNVISSFQWIKYCGIFKATTAANVVVIGNFSEDPSTKVINLTGSSASDSYYDNSYYFIDDVSVEKIPAPDSLILTVSGNKTICQNQATSLSVLQHFDQISWTTVSDTVHTISSDSIFKVAPSATITYRVKGEVCTVTAKDTVTIHVIPTPSISLGNDATLCAGNTLMLNAGTGFSSYQWQDNSTNYEYEVTKAGNYSVTVKNRFGCSDQASVTIDYLDLPKVNLGRDTLECASFAELNATSKGSSYVWSSGSKNSTIIPTTSGKYWVTVTNQCGHSSDTIQIYSMDNLFVPNVVTFNHDGQNDSFRFTGVGNASASLRIINRWGEMIFNDNHYFNSWPSPNQEIAAGTYYYALELPGCPQTKGWIQVLK